MLDFRTVEKLLLYLGFNPTRQKGSHVFFRHPDGRTTTVPHHKGRDITRPLLREILREIEISPDQLEELIEKI
ncbi:MAG TPA: type II toxin-antitoxin system HicA family toxin [Candidatus Kapabacteria bacterium]|nr:type II toxin-antitoxin system HicA family toxin [Candidatus Kapabacteria bacterium]